MAHRPHARGRGQLCHEVGGFFHGRRGARDEGGGRGAAAQGQRHALAVGGHGDALWHGGIRWQRLCRCWSLQSWAGASSARLRRARGDAGAGAAMAMAGTGAALGVGSCNVQRPRAGQAALGVARPGWPVERVSCTLLQSSPLFWATRAWRSSSTLGWGGGRAWRGRWAASRCHAPGRQASSASRSVASVTVTETTCARWLAVRSRSAVRGFRRPAPVPLACAATGARGFVIRAPTCAARRRWQRSVRVWLLAGAARRFGDELLR